MVVLPLRRVELRPRPTNHAYMHSDISINLAGIPDERWTDPIERCAVCLRHFEHIREVDPDHVPLLLWRKDGKEMLRLCWPCAEPRIRSQSISGSE